MAESAGSLPLSDHSLFYRRIWPKWIETKATQPITIRPGSVAFKDGRREVSLFRADRITVDEVMEGYPDHSLVTVDFGTLRRLGLTVEHRPAEGGDAHYVIHPYPTGSKSKKLAKAAEWVKYRGPEGRDSWRDLPPLT